LSIQLSDSQAQALLNYYQLTVRDLWGFSLYPHQAQIAQHVLKAAVERSGETIVTIMPRQSGKSELLITLPIFMAMNMPGLAIGTYAPTFLQVRDILLRRAKQRLNVPFFKDRWRHNGPNLIEFAAPSEKFGPYADTALRQSMLGYYSADPKASKRGMTWAALLLDEAQDITRKVIDDELLPTVATTNGLVWYSLTPWSVDSKAYAVYSAVKDGQVPGKVFEFDCYAVQEHIPGYKSFITRQKKEIGADSIAFRTNYLCKWIQGLGMWFDPLVLDLRGSPDFEWCITQPSNEIAGKPGETCWYCAGLDISAGMDDYTALVISRVDLSGLVTALFATQWRTTDWDEQLQTLLKILKHDWPDVSYLTVDATGVGNNLAYKLSQELPWTNVERLNITSILKSDIGYWFDTLWSQRRVYYAAKNSDPAAESEDGSLSEPRATFLHQARWLVRDSMTGRQRLNYYVKPSYGHDDMVMAWFLSVYGARNLISI